jgi:hypothetical protein
MLVTVFIALSGSEVLFVVVSLFAGTPEIRLFYYPIYSKVDMKLNLFMHHVMNTSGGEGSSFINLKVSCDLLNEGTALGSGRLTPNGRASGKQCLRV